MGIATGAFLRERNDWPAAIGRARNEEWATVELTAITEGLFADLCSFLSASSSDPLGSFDRVSVHAPAVVDSPVQEVAQRVLASGLSHDLVFHPDLFYEAASLAELGRQVVFENMDVNKEFGRTTSDLADVFDRFPDAGFCLDVAHVWTNDRSLELGFELLGNFAPRLRQVHVSGIDPDGTHRPTMSADLALYEPLLQRCTHVPWLLESELLTTRSGQRPRE
jgi:hypothetical protein